MGSGGGSIGSNARPNPWEPWIDPASTWDNQPAACCFGCAPPARCARTEATESAAHHHRHHTHVIPLLPSLLLGVPPASPPNAEEGRDGYSRLSIERIGRKRSRMYFSITPPDSPAPHPPDSAIIGPGGRPRASEYRLERGGIRASTRGP